MGTPPCLRLAPLLQGIGAAMVGVGVAVVFVASRWFL